uniref:hypothetical protein n=1 Tax=Staphylococcus epidermidis TaxID=1282 RepID=UPI00273A243C
MKKETRKSVFLFGLAILALVLSFVGVGKGVAAEEEDLNVAIVGLDKAGNQVVQSIPAGVYTK